MVESALLYIVSDSCALCGMSTLSIDILHDLCLWFKDIQTFISYVGTDEFGHMCIDILKENKVNNSGEV